MTVGPRFHSRIRGKMRPSFAAMQIIEVISSVSDAQSPRSIGPGKITEQSRPNKSEPSKAGL